MEGQRKIYLISGLKDQEKDLALYGLKMFWAGLEYTAEQYVFGNGRKNDTWEIFTYKKVTPRELAEGVAFVRGVCFALSHQKNGA